MSGHIIEIRGVPRNKRINHIKVKCERIYMVVKTAFGSESVKLTTMARVDIKILFTALDYNFYQLCTLKKKGLME